MSVSDDDLSPLTKARDKLGLTVDLLAVECTVSSSPRYTLITTLGSAHLGTRRWMTHQAEFRAAVCEVTHNMPKALRRPDWDRVCQWLCEAETLIDLGSDATEAGLGSEWLTDYLSESKPISEDGEGWMMALDSKLPIWHNGDLLIHSATLRLFVSSEYDEKVDHLRMASILEAVGCKPRKVDIKSNGSRRQQQRWIVGQQRFLRVICARS